MDLVNWRERIALVCASQSVSTLFRLFPAERTSRTVLPVGLPVIAG